MSERGWAQEPWDYEELHESNCGRPCTPEGCHEGHPSGLYKLIGPAVDIYDGTTFENEQDVRRIVACINALAAVGNPEGLPELLREMLHDDLSPWVRKLFDALQIDEEKLAMTRLLVRPPRNQYFWRRYYKRAFAKMAPFCCGRRTIEVGRIYLCPICLRKLP